MRSFLVALVMLSGAVGPAGADPLNFKGKDYLAMNENYRVGLVHGLMASFVDLGSPDRYREFILHGYGCLDRRACEDNSGYGSRAGQIH
jgi:hypothetical protein